LLSFPYSISQEEISVIISSFFSFLKKPVQSSICGLKSIQNTIEDIIRDTIQSNKYFYLFYFLFNEGVELNDIKYKSLYSIIKLIPQHKLKK
jgi:hypothetical protein